MFACCCCFFFLREKSGKSPCWEKIRRNWRFHASNFLDFSKNLVHAKTPISIVVLLSKENIWLLNKQKKIQNHNWHVSLFTVFPQRNVKTLYTGVEQELGSWTILKKMSLFSSCSILSWLLLFVYMYQWLDTWYDACSEDPKHKAYKIYLRESLLVSLFWKSLCKLHIKWRSRFLFWA